jgi:hypothetical protein
LHLTSGEQRRIEYNSLGRKIIVREKVVNNTGFIHVFYCSRALEWINMKKFFSEIFMLLSIPQFIPALLNIMFAWTYHPNVSVFCYKPSMVFKRFDVSELNMMEDNCICNSSRRFNKFIDKETSTNNQEGKENNGHVRTMDLSIIQHKGLRHALKMGLNQIPLRPTLIHETIQVVFDTFLQVCEVLNITHMVDMEIATKEVRNGCRKILLEAYKINKFGFRYSQTYLFEDKHVNDELEWLLNHVYISGLDKASNNACFICIDHIRKQAYQRLNSLDFLPCLDNDKWLSISDITSNIHAKITEIIPELSIDNHELPYIMAIYKFHKKKYRWISNAFGSIYVNLATLVTIATMALLDEVKQWAKTTTTGYKNFLQVDTSIYWIIDSINEFCLNLPEHVHNIYVADITRCFETIPVNGQDTLFEAMEFITSLGIKNFKRKHPRSEPLIWYRTNANGTPSRAVWASTCPNYGSWHCITVEKFLTLHKWLTTNCFVRLGNRVWKQILGIPMGFSCSPLWCNLYLMSYEIKFIQRLAKLGRTDIMARFNHAFRYIDDLCWLNVGNAQTFLDPAQPRTWDNPFWIYPLHILEIKTEVSNFSTVNPTSGIKAHFMNVLMTISNEDNGVYTIQKFDKRRDLPFTYTQYIKFNSNRPVKQAYNVIVSQTVPILYLSNDVYLAKREIETLVSTLANNGFRRQKLLQLVIKTLSRTTYPAVRFTVKDLITLLQGTFTVLIHLYFTLLC